MNSFPSQKKVLEAIIKGISNAHENFFSWTNSRLSLSYGPNKIISIHVAQEIAKIENPPEIYIDAAIADILKCSLGKKKSFSTFMREKALAQGIFSITLDKRFEHKDDTDLVSKVIISVKNALRNPKLEYLKEIEKICKMIDSGQDSSLDYGVLAFYSDLSENARKKLEKRIPQIVESFDEVVQQFPNLKSFFQTSGIKKMKENGQWCASCYIIERV